jgi:uncharacterized membrane protein YsdA (DUF1294 family)
MLCNDILVVSIWYLVVSFKSFWFLVKDKEKDARRSERVKKQKLRQRVWVEVNEIAASLCSSQ